jgi:hypothetical protein
VTADEFGVLQFVRFCEDVLEHPFGEDSGAPRPDWMRQAGLGVES